MRIILAISFLVLSLVIQCQQYNSYSFNELYNFSENTIYDLTQDDKGYVWIGTSNGLYQFNGHNFNNYKYPDFDKEYTNVKIDKGGRVWFINFGGQLFFLENNEPKLFSNKEGKGNFVQDYFFHRDSSILYFKREGEELFQQSLGESTSQSIFKTKNGFQIVSCTKNNEILTIYCIGREEKNIDFKVIKVFEFNLQNQSTTLEKVYTIPKGENGTMIIHHNNNAYFLAGISTVQLYHLTDSLKHSFSIPSLQITDINGIQVINDHFWFLTKNGVREFDSKGNLINHSFKHHSVSTILKDFENTVWACSLNKGIQLIANTSIRSQTVRGSEIRYSTNTSDGTTYYTDYDGRFYHINRQGDIEEIEHSQKISSHFTYNSNNRLIYFHNSNFTYNTSSQQFEKIKHPIAFKDMTPISKNSYIITTSIRSGIRGNNLNELKEIDALYQLSIDFSESSHYYQIRGKRCAHSTIDSSNNGLYIAYIDRLYYYSTTSAPKEVLLHDNPVLANNVVSGANAVWALTENNELLGLKNGEVVEYHKMDTKCHGITPYQNYLVLYNQHTITRLNTSNGKQDAFGVVDGLLNEPILNLSVLNDTLHILGSHYLQQLPFNFVKPKGSPPRVFVSGLEINGNTTNDTTDLQLNYNENNLTIRFQAVSIRSRKEHTFEYRLNESETWTTTSSSAPYAQFNNLAPGTYYFELRAKGIDGQFSVVKTLQFTIYPHYSQTWWFTTVIILVLVGMVFGLMRWRLKTTTQKNQLKNEQESLKKDLYKSKIAAIRSQMNPHFMFNALNTIQQFIIANQQDIASEYLADFADLMRMYLDQSKSETISLSEEMETLNIYLKLEQLRYNHELNFSITAEEDISLGNTYIPVMLLQPFVENSIKHGLLHKEGEKILTIHFSKNGPEITCTITDNGIGREASETINASKKIRHTSFATSAIDERVKLVNKGYSGQLSIAIEDLYENQTAAGTKVILKIIP